MAVDHLSLLSRSRTVDERDNRVTKLSLFLSCRSSSMKWKRERGRAREREREGSEKQMHDLSVSVGRQCNNTLEEGMMKVTSRRSHILPWLNAVTRVQSRNYTGHVIAWKWGGLLRRLRLFSPCNSETNVGNGEQRGWPVKAIK